MDDAGTATSGRRSRRWLASAALVGSGLIAGGVLAGMQLAQAADGSTAGTGGTLMAPTDVRHGPGETLLTGSEATDVRAAALDEVPDGTIIRVETDSGGAAYEAHVQRADGTTVTVTFDADLEPLDTIEGFGPVPMQPSADASA